MAQRQVISFAPTGLIKLYYDKISNDIKEDIKQSVKDGIESTSGNTAILNRIVSRYFALNYGQEEQRKVRNDYYADFIQDLEGDQADLVRQHESS